jgi:lysophospholipase L1-like esterase
MTPVSRLWKIVVSAAILAGAIAVLNQAAAGVEADKLQVISLGDSFIAGVGAGNYYPNQGTGSPPLSEGVASVPSDGRNCYQSYSSYPWQYTQMLNDSGVPAEVWHVACISAHIDDVVDQAALVPEDWWPEADIVLLSAGGNDGGFSDIATWCMVANDFGGKCIDAIEVGESYIFGGFEDELIEALRHLIEVEPTSKTTRFVIMGYPFLADPPGIACKHADRIDALQEQHNHIISEISKAHPQIEAVTVSAEFAGKGPCSGSERLVNYVLDGGANSCVHIDVPLAPDFHISCESFHPTFDGHKTYAQALFDADLHVGLGGGTTATGTHVSTAIIVDSSGSMRSNDPEARRLDASVAYLNASLPEDEVGVVRFTSSARVLSEAVAVGTNRESLRQAIRSIGAGGGTNLGRGLQAGCEVLQRSSGGQRAAIFLTDGLGSYGDQARCYADRGWRVFTIGLGSGVDASLLSRIATETGGHYRQLTSATNIVCEFQQIRSVIQGNSAQDCGPTANIQQGQTIRSVESVARALSQITFTNIWIGSDIEMTLRSPDGRAIDRQTIASDASIEVGPSFETITVRNPAQGDWTVELFGADIPPGGEPFSFSTVRLAAPDVPDPAPSPQPSPTTPAVRPSAPPVPVVAVSASPNSALEPVGQILNRPSEPTGPYGFGTEPPNITMPATVPLPDSQDEVAGIVQLRDDNAQNAAMPVPSVMAEEPTSTAGFAGQVLTVPEPQGSTESVPRSESAPETSQEPATAAKTPGLAVTGTESRSLTAVSMLIAGIGFSLLGFTRRREQLVEE